MSAAVRSPDLEHMVDSVADASHIAAIMLERCLKDAGEDHPTSAEHKRHSIDRTDEAALFHAVYEAYRLAKEVQRLYHEQIEGVAP